jgi:hypothetical protein
VTRKRAAHDCAEALELNATLGIDRNGFEQVAYDAFVKRLSR